jgi:hypothetical protein
LGPFDPAQVQIHDVNPGDLNEPGSPNHFPHGGVFWTRAIPAKTVVSHPGRGDARFQWIGFPLLDYFDVVNAVFRTGPDPVPAMASVDVRWTGTGRRMKVRNDVQGFGGQYESASAMVQWSVSNAEGYFFSTANSSHTNLTSAFTAHVHNGVFRR